MLMLKVLVLQKHYGLSDDQTEFQIKDRFSFMQFPGLQAGRRPDGFEKDTTGGRQKDCDARWAKKNDEPHYGLVVNYAGTAANVHDSKIFEQLVDGQDEAVFADSAYLSESNREHLPDKN